MFYVSFHVRTTSNLKKESSKKSMTDRPTDRPMCQEIKSLSIRRRLKFWPFKHKHSKWTNLALINDEYHTMLKICR